MLPIAITTIWGNGLTWNAAAELDGLNVPNPVARSPPQHRAMASGHKVAQGPGLPDYLIEPLDAYHIIIIIVRRLAGLAGLWWRDGAEAGRRVFENRRAVL